MELTINEALQKGIAAQKAGEVQKADSIFTAILKVQPNNPDANHNMGLLAVGVGNFQESLKYFKTALEANSNISQFWLSYIDALIKLGKTDDAKVVFVRAKNNGFKGDDFHKLEQRLKISSKVFTKIVPRSQEVEQGQLNIIDTLTLNKAIKLAERKSKAGSSEEAKSIYQDILAKFPKNKRAIDGIKGLSGKTIGKAFHTQEPHDLLQSLIDIYSHGQLQQALIEAKRLIKKFPVSFTLYNIYGAINQGLGKLDAAIDSFKQAINIKPNYADAYYNMGSVLDAQGKLDEAIKAYKKALAIKPDYADAYYNMGNVLKNQGKLEAAIGSYNKELSINPKKAEAFYNMGNTLKEQGKIEDAVKAYNKALSIKPDYGHAKHMISSLTGKTTNSAPRDYIENLFDVYASHFENSLINKLEYEIPRTLSDIIKKENNNENLGSILDLGCGTGLIGVELKDFCTNLEGIDLSSAMLEQAKKKNVYSKLTHIDIIDYLSTVELNFDYFLAVDVFVYVGELSEVFNLIKCRNKRSGKLVFSTEHTKKIGFHLEKSGRYTHSTAYIERLCKKFGYSISYFSKVNLRKDNGIFLTGGLYAIDFTY